MEVGNGQEILGPALNPLLFSQKLALWAMAVSAGVIGDLTMTAMVALVHMTAKGSCPADLNSMHYLQLIEGQRMGGSIVGAALTKDIRHLDAASGTHRISDYDEAGLSRGLATCPRFTRLTWR